jgi:alkylation response protein AidB-like acyl-CoA dehydrogenase
MSERAETTGGNTSLTREEGQWVLNGEKYYCTGTIYADWIAAAGKDGDARVSVILPATAPGVTRQDDWDGFGQRLTGSGTTKFDRVVIQEEHILKRHSADTHRNDNYTKAFYQLVLLSALAGIARAVVRDGVAFVQPRTRTFGIPGNSSPRHDPLVQRVIGRLSSLSSVVDSIVDGLALTLDEVYQSHLAGKVEEATYIQAELKAFQAQQIVIDLVLQATTLVFEVGGASATSENRRLDRHWRNARTVASHNPAIQRERAIGDYLLNGTSLDTNWVEGMRRLQEQRQAKEKADGSDRSNSLPVSEDNIGVHPNGDGTNGHFIRQSSEPEEEGLLAVR